MHLPRMSTLILELSDELAARLQAASLEKHVPPENLALQAVEKMLRVPAAEFPEDGPSILERMGDAVGCIDSGVTDLATNPKYMEGYGRCRSQS